MSLTFSASLRFQQAHASLLKNVSANLLALASAQSDATGIAPQQWRTRTRGVSCWQSWRTGWWVLTTECASGETVVVCSRQKNGPPHHGAARRAAAGRVRAAVSARGQRCSGLGSCADRRASLRGEPPSEGFQHHFILGDLASDHLCDPEIGASIGVEDAGVFLAETFLRISGNNSQPVQSAVSQA